MGPMPEVLANGSYGSELIEDSCGRCRGTRIIGGGFGLDEDNSDELMLALKLRGDNMSLSVVV